MDITIYTEEDYYNLPESVRAELIDGQRFTFQDKIKVNIYDDLYIDFAGLDL